MKYDDVKIEIYVPDTGGFPVVYNWFDISDYINDDLPITFTRGIMGNKLQDKTARPGTLTFSIRDTSEAGLFYPLLSTSTSWAFREGLYIRVVFELEDINYCKYFGKITNIDPPRDNLYQVDAAVVSKDFLLEVSHSMQTPGITVNKTAAEVVDDVLDGLGITLGADQYEYNACQTTFPTVFDTVSSKQSGLAEISKAIVSELGYFYLKGNRIVSDETNSTDKRPDSGDFIVTVDGRNTREARSYRTIPVGDDMAGFLLKEDGGYLLKEDSGKIVLNTVETPEKFDAIAKMKHETSSGIVNRVYVQVYPREYSGATDVLFSLATTPSIDPGDTLEMTVKYKNPDIPDASITARSMVTPVSSTDYTANAQADGGGADLNANLSVTAVYNAADINYTLENTGGTKLYITKLQARGQGILFLGTLTFTSENSSSIELYEEREERVNMKYRSDINEAQEIAGSIITNLAAPFRQVDFIEIDANLSSRHLFMCMFLEIGDPIKVTLPDDNFEPADYKFYVNGLTFTGLRGIWKATYTLAAPEIVEI